MCGYDDFQFDAYLRANGGPTSDLATGEVFVTEPSGARVIVGSLAGCTFCRDCRRHAAGDRCGVCGGPTFIAGETPTAPR